jgi:hypothetical protein
MSIDLNTRMALPDEPWPEYHRGKLFGNWVSTGKDFVQVESPEGQAILNERIVVRDPALAKAKAAFEAKHIIAAVFLLLLAVPALAAEAPVKQEPAKPGEAGVTIADCLGILSGLNALDAGGRRIVAEGKPTESAETIHFKLPGKVRDAIGHNEFVLAQVQQEAQAANRRVQLEIMGSGADPIKPGTKENLIFDQRMSEYMARSCAVQLDHIRDADLDLDHNDIPGSVLSLLTKIRDK